MQNMHSDFFFFFNSYETVDETISTNESNLFYLRGTQRPLEGHLGMYRKDTWKFKEHMSTQGT